jgi:ketosteroid isomerase-like protein
MRSSAARAASLDPAALLDRLTLIETRLAEYTAATAIRACVHRYMALCDHLDAATPMNDLLDCFTEDAVWIGKGARYDASFGGHRGRAAIGTMLGAYRGSLPGEPGPVRPPHFVFNAHFLCNEHITAIEADTAQAEWAMLQTSTFASGAAHLNAAHLSLQMRRDIDGRWRIARFETENLLSRPIDHWHSDAALPVPER